jgi:hypothetical protein
MRIERHYLGPMLASLDSVALERKLRLISSMHPFQAYPMTSCDGIRVRLQTYRVNGYAVRLRSDEPHSGFRGPRDAQGGDLLIADVAMLTVAISSPLGSQCAINVIATNLACGAICGMLCKRGLGSSTGVAFRAQAWIAPVAADRRCEDLIHNSELSPVA